QGYPRQRRPSALLDLADVTLRDLIHATTVILVFDHAGVIIDFRLVVRLDQLTIAGPDQVIVGAADQGQHTGDTEHRQQPVLHGSSLSLATTCLKVRSL